jgi:threonine dehydratase
MIQLADVLAARERVQMSINPTPLLRDDVLSKSLGTPVYLKAECLQKSGSFKVRGAFNKISHLSAEERGRGVIAPSAGNHAQGVAMAAALHGVEATIVMPSFAPLTKIQATKSYGASVILHGSSFDDAAQHAKDLAQEHGYTYVHAFNDPQIIAGQGTLGLEVLEALPNVDVLLVPIGGGGLIGGVALAIKTLRPQTKIIGVQASGCSAVLPSLAAGAPVAVSVAQTIADGIAVKRPGDLTLPLIEAHVDEVLEVSDDEIARAIAHCVSSARLVVEGAGAAGLAALLAGKVDFEAGQNICAVLCGGNIDGNLLARVLEQVMVRQGRYVLFKLAVIDRPGALAQITDRVAEAGANIIDIFHRRALWLAPLGKVGVELVLEVRDAEHGQAVQAYLEQHGYHVAREAQGDWLE